jgi:predicted transport protein
MPRVFCRNNVNALQDLESPQGDVAQITDWCRYHVKHSISSVQSLPHAIESMTEGR